MRRRHAGGLLTAVLLVLVAAACGPPRPLTPEVSYDYFCARCHGDDGTGDPDAVKLNPKLDLLRAEMVREGDRELVRERIVEGKGSMPGFRDKLEPHEVEELVTYTLERFGRGGAGGAEGSGE
ncbi:MAG: cytochrome c [Acidobacteriota bacterium]